jgi:hypothetical protein
MCFISSGDGPRREKVEPRQKEVKRCHMQRLLFSLVALAFTLLAQEPSRSCSWSWSSVTEPAQAIGADQHASYYGLRVIPSPGDHLEVDAAFPHARYLSWTVYSNRLVASINDRQIQPVRGRNPFHPAVSRHEPGIARYRLTFRFDQGAKEKANTLHVPGADGNRKFVILYRLFDIDRAYRAGPLSASGGAPAPVLRLYDAAGKSYCPDPLPPDEQARPPARQPPADIENPPFWRHTGSTTTETTPFANEGVVSVCVRVPFGQARAACRTALEASANAGRDA